MTNYAVIFSKMNDSLKAMCECLMLSVLGVKGCKGEPGTRGPKENMGPKGAPGGEKGQQGEKGEMGQLWGRVMLFCQSIRPCGFYFVCIIKRDSILHKDAW